MADHEGVESSQSGASADPAPGGASTVVGSLDMADQRDQGLVRRAAAGHTYKKKRWPGIDDTLKRKVVNALEVAIEISVEDRDANGINGAAKTISVLEGQNQADEHVEEKYRRLDAGQATEGVQHVRRVILQIDGDAPCPTSSTTT